MKLPESSFPTFYLGKLMGYISVWFEFDNASPNLPTFVRDSIQRGISIGVEYCQLSGFNFRRLIAEDLDDETRMNIHAVDLEMSMDSFQALLGFMAQLRASQFCDDSSKEWLESSPCRVVLQRLGQDAAVRDGNAVKNYVDDLFRFLNRRMISSVKIAFAQNIYSEQNPVEPNYLGLVGDPCRELFTGLDARYFPTFDLQSVVRVQAKNMPSSFVETLEIPNGVSIVSCQVYSTSKALLRPTDYEEPFSRGDLTKGLLSRSASQHTLKQKLIFANKIFEKLRFLKNQRAGLRAEYEIVIDMSQNDRLASEDDSLSQTIVQCFETFKPFDNQTKCLFGSPIDSIAVALKSSHIFEYAEKILGHLYRPIERIYRQILDENDCVSPDFLEIVSIMERLCRCFLSGNYRYVSKAMRINKILENVRDYGIPFFPRRLIDLRNLKISWQFWKDPNENMHMISFDFFASRPQKDLFQSQISVLAFVRNLEEELRRSNMTHDEFYPRLCRAVHLIVNTMVLECRSHFLMKMESKMQIECTDDASFVESLKDLPPSRFFSPASRAMIESRPEFSWKSGSYDLTKFMREVFVSTENFRNYFFKDLFREVLAIWMLYDWARAEDAFTDQLAHSLYVKQISWFLLPMTRASTTRLIYVHSESLPSENSEEEGENQMGESSTMGTRNSALRNQLPRLNNPISLSECPDMQSAFDITLTRLQKKMATENQQYNACLGEACTLFSPQSDPMDLFALLTFWLCFKNTMKRSTKKIGNDRQAGALLLHYIVLKWPTTAVKDRVLKHFGGDTGCAFQNYGAGKKFLKKIGFLETNRSTVLNHRYLRTFTMESIIHATSLSQLEQIDFFGLGDVLDQ